MNIKQGSHTYTFEERRKIKAKEYEEIANQFSSWRIAYLIVVFGTSEQPLD